MPKLLWKSLWKWIINLITAAVVWGLIMMVGIWYFNNFTDGDISNLYYNYFALMCIPYMIFMFGRTAATINEQFFLAPYSFVQRKNLIRKYFCRQFRLGCILTAAWYICVCNLIVRLGMPIHPVKAVFGVAMQFCIIYQLLFLNYYCPRILFVMTTSISLIGGCVAVMGMMQEPTLSITDFVLMAVFGIICIVPVLVLHFEHFEQLVDYNANYESSRKIVRGLG